MWRQEERYRDMVWHREAVVVDWAFPHSFVVDKNQ